MFRFHHSVPRARVFAKDFIDFFKISEGKTPVSYTHLIPQVASFEELLQRLQAAGYEIKTGKYISCRAPGQERFTRLKTLGADYTCLLYTSRCV